jgi:hypothetical protein
MVTADAAASAVTVSATNWILIEAVTANVQIQQLRT